MTVLTSNWSTLSGWLLETIAFSEMGALSLLGCILLEAVIDWANPERGLPGHLRERSPSFVLHDSR